MATFNHISGQEPSTISFKVATVTQTRNSSLMHQEILSIGDPDSSAAIAAVVNQTPGSTAWALAVREVAPSTLVAVSSLAGAVIVRSSKADALVTAYQSTAADLNVTAAQGGTWNVSSLAGIVAVRPSDTNWASSAGFHFTSSGELQVSGTFSASTTVNVSSLAGAVIVRSSAADALVTVYQSSAADLNARIIFAAGLISSAIQAGGSSALTVRNVWSSTNADQPVSAAQAGTWNIGTVTTITTVTSVSSLSTGHVTVDTGSIRVHQSTASDFQATVTPVAGSTFNVRPLQSSQADLRVTVYQSSATELLATVTIGTNLQSTAAPSSNSSGLVVRQVVDVLTSFASTSALASTVIEVQSSGAGLRTYVTAYTITSTNQTPAHWGFFSSNATLLWPLTLAALSSAVAGANLAVAPPGYLFRTTASEALNFKTAGSSVSGVQLGVSYFRAP